MRSLLLAALLLPTAAAAGPTLALRSGYALSAGEAAKGTPMSEVAKGAIPLQLDARWKFGPHFSLGASYGFAFGRLSPSVSDACDALGASCSVWTMRLGLDVEWAFAELSKRVAPWIGAGFGYEWAHERVSRGGRTARQDVSGWEALSLEAGADFKAGRKLSIGPWVNARWAEYGRLDGYAIVNKAFHTWYGAGVRGRWDF